MTETPAEKAEAAAIRRRWITLGEIVAVAGLIISALALYLSYADRRADEAERQREKASEEKVRSVVLLTAEPADGGRKLALRGREPYRAEHHGRFPERHRHRRPDEQRHP